VYFIEITDLNGQPFFPLSHRLVSEPLMLNVSQNSAEMNVTLSPCVWSEVCSSGSTQYRPGAWCVLFIPLQHSKHGLKYGDGRARPAWPKPEARRVESGLGFSGRGLCCPLPKVRVRGLGERCKLPQRGPGQSPGNQQIFHILACSEWLSCCVLITVDGRYKKCYMLIVSLRWDQGWKIASKRTRFLGFIS